MNLPTTFAASPLAQQHQWRDLVHELTEHADPTVYLRAVTASLPSTGISPSIPRTTGTSAHHPNEVHEVPISHAHLGRPLLHAGYVALAWDKARGWRLVMAYRSQPEPLVITAPFSGTTPAPDQVAQWATQALADPVGAVTEALETASS